jgi:hypothetical protein
VRQAIGVAVVAAVGLLGFNIAFLASAIAGVTASVAFLGFVSPFRLRPCVRRRRGLLAAACVVLIGLNATSLRYQTARLERRLEPVIHALGEHRRATGAFPHTLRALVPRHLTTVPGCSGWPEMSVIYTADADRYSLTCLTWGFNHHSYDSQTGRWRDWD